MEYIDVVRNVMKIKEIDRSGWVKKGIDAESVADHSFGVSFLALTIDLPDGVDRQRLTNMGIVHDAGESLFGDVIWEQGITANKEIYDSKAIKEEAALRKLFKEGSVELELALEFAELKTPTALFLKELDKLEMVFQALEYEKQVENNVLDEFWANADKYLKSKSTRELFEKLVILRKEIIQNKN